jgi:hypothetical protein
MGWFEIDIKLIHLGPTITLTYNNKQSCSPLKIVSIYLRFALVHTCPPSYVQISIVAIPMGSQIPASYSSSFHILIIYTVTPVSYILGD